MSKNTTVNSGGIGFTGLLTVAFVVLKLTKQIDWSWWWVMSPVFFTIGLSIVVLVIAFAYYAWRER